MKANNGKMITKSHAYTSSNKDKDSSTVSSSPSLRTPFDNNRRDNVLILQGGGSLGAFGCGVFKSLANNNIKIDIVAGTSIGGINAAIIAGSKDEENPEQMLEQFWLELSESLVKTLEKYIDYDKLKPGGNPNSRLILTAVNILTAEPLTFDSFKKQITPKHILATSAYPLYNFRWVEVEDGVYAWDGGLLSNTPLREVIEASPVNDKRICIVENYPKRIDVLPNNLPEVYHRARDIIFSDKTKHNVTMSKVISRYLEYIEELHKILEDNIDRINIDQKQLKRIRRKYKKYKQKHGAEIKDIVYVTRDEPLPHMYENADFSPETIKSSIKEGEMKAIRELKSHLK